MSSRKRAAAGGLPGLEELVMLVSGAFNQLLRENVYEANLSRREYEMLEVRKKKLRHALKVCALGDLEAKSYIKGLVADVLVERYHVDSDNINSLIDFGNPDRLTPWDMFQILLVRYRESYGMDALQELFCQSGWEGRGIIRAEDVWSAYMGCMPMLGFVEKLEVVTQRIYCLYKGLGVADDIRELKVDGVSGGVSGSDASQKSLWVFMGGRSVNLEFLKFGSDRELERICSNIYRHNRPGHLSRSRGYIVNDMADHSRVVVARPPFCESWVFFVRKFDKQGRRHVGELYDQPNHELVERLLALLVKGCQNCAITGAQGSGKTTLLMTLIEHIPEDYNLRIQELAFELHLRDIYPERNIVTFRETDSISGQEGLDLQKKTDGTVNILGEVATAPVAGWMIQMGLTASLFTLFTHHAKTTKSLVSAMVNALLSEGIYRDEAAATRQVVEVIRFDIHVGIGGDGVRRLERICEIVRLDEGYGIRELVAYENGEYVHKGRISHETAVLMCMHMQAGDAEVLLNEFAE